MVKDFRPISVIARERINDMKVIAHTSGRAVDGPLKAERTRSNAIVFFLNGNKTNVVCAYHWVLNHVE